MKNSWLFIGLVCLLAQWCSSSLLLGIELVLALYFYLRHYHFHPCFILVLLILIFPHLQSKDLIKPDETSHLLQVKEIKNSYIIADNGTQRVLVYGADKVNFDDVIQIEGKYEVVDTIHNISDFSFTSWLSKHNIHFQLQSKNVKILKQGRSLRHAFYQKIQNISSKDGKTWVKAMLFQIHDNELSYFITSSGMHLSFIAYWLQRQLKRFTSKQHASLLVLLFLVFAGVITVFSASLLRIICFRFITYLFEKDSTADKVGKSMCLTLILFPYMAFEFAFLLPLAFRLVQIFQSARASSTMISMGIMIPFQFMFFHTCDPFQILLFRILRPFYALLYFVAWLYAFLKISFLYEISQQCIQFLQVFQRIQGTFFYTPGFFWLLAWVYFLTKYFTYHKKLGYMVVLFLYTPLAPYFDPFGEVMMLDVGQGDCTLLTLAHHQGIMLIDVMGSHYKNVPKDIIVPLLHSKGITSIDKVIITHEDYDHSGGLQQLQEQIEVKEVLREKVAETTLGPMHIPFLLSQYKGKDNNDNSILTYMELYGLHILFMGDAGSKVESEILKQYANLHADVIKVGHHGSATSSSLAFLHQMDAKIALISAGRKNRYGHPHKETLSRLKQEDILPLTTALNGGVSIKFCKYFAFFRTADNEFGIIKFR